jgi:hypothetical protein
VPPPPANQVVHVVLSKPVKVRTGLEKVVVYGKLEVARKVHPLATMSYRMRADKADVKLEN